MPLRQRTRLLAVMAGFFLTALPATELFAQSAACRARCDREYGDHPGRFSACVNQCPRARVQPSYSGGAQTDWNYCSSSTLGTAEERIQRCTSLIDGNASPQDRAIAYSNRGLLWFNQKDYESAIADYNESLKLKPNDQDVIGKRADAYRDKGDHDRAIEDYSLAIRLAPTPENYQGRCYARAAADRDLDLALADCDLALRRKPTDADILESRGFVNLRMERLDDAMADLNAALRHHPGLASSLFVRGIVKLKRGDTSGGNADIAAAKGIQSDIAESFAIYGVLPVAATKVQPASPLPPIPAAIPTPSPAPAPAAASDCAMAEAHWKAADSIGTAGAYLDHLKRFPNCTFSDLARMKIEAMKK
jgi:tetratricopeptide (TPR) repeat protein